MIGSCVYCRYCTEVKTLFKRLGVQPLVIELDELGMLVYICLAFLKKSFIYVTHLLDYDNFKTYSIYRSMVLIERG